MKEIRLHGRHATGTDSFARVDDSEFERLNAYHWKAKPNGNGDHVYAVRNAICNGKSITIRMHREVLGDIGKLDVRFFNGNRLDCQRCNLIAAPRKTSFPSKRGSLPSVLPKASRRPRPVVMHVAQACAFCDNPFTPVRNGQLYCSDRCRCRAKAIRMETGACAACGVAFQPVRLKQVTCSARCKKAHRRAQGTKGTSSANRKHGCETAQIRASSEASHEVSKCQADWVLESEFGQASDAKR